MKSGPTGPLFFVARNKNFSQFQAHRSMISQSTNISILSKIFPTLGFHNRSITELWLDPERVKRAEHVDGLPYAMFVEKPFKAVKLPDGNIYETRLYCFELYGDKMDASLEKFKSGQDSHPIFKTFTNDHGNGSRGAFVVRKREASTNYIEIGIFLDKSSLVVSDPDNQQEALKRLLERTYVFATEFIGSYRGYISGIINEWSNAPSYHEHDVIQAPLEAASTDGSFEHPTPSDVCRLLCNFKLISEVLLKVHGQCSPPPSITGVHDFLDLEAAIPPSEFIGKYYKEWEEEERVHRDIARRKTCEYLVSIVVNGQGEFYS